MSSPKSHPIRDLIFAPLIVVAVPSLITTLVPGGWHWVFVKLGDLWSWLNGIARIHVWLLILLVVLSLAFFAIIAFMAFAALFSGGAVQGPDPIQTGLYYDIRWRWKLGQEGIYDLASFCPVCDLQIRPKSDGYSVKFYCEDCRKNLQSFEQQYSDVQNLIIRKIQKEIRPRSKTEGAQP